MGKILLIDQLVATLEESVIRGQILQAHPYNWRPGEILALEKSPWRLLRWGFNVCFVYSYVTFLWFRVVQTSFLEKTGMVRKVYMGFAGGFYTIAPVLAMSLIFRTDELISFVRSGFSFLETVERRYVLLEAKPPRIILLLPALLKVVNLCFYGIALSFSSIALVFPSSPELIVSLFSSGSDTNWTIRLGGMLIQLYLLCLQAGFAHVLINMCLGLCLPFIVVMNELREKTSKFTISAIRTPKNVIGILRELELLMDNLNKVISSTLLGITICIFIIAVFSFYGSFRLSGLASLILGFIGINHLFIFSLTIAAIAETHDRTQKILSGLRNHGTDTSGWTSRALKPLRPIRVFIGSVYYVDKPLVFTSFKIVFDCTVNFFLMNPM